MDYSLLLVVEEVQVKKEDAEFMKEKLERELRINDNKNMLSRSNIIT